MWCRHSTEPCKIPLGLENGHIKDDQLSAFSAYNDDFSTFGAHRARLNLTISPPGYRARNDFSDQLPWIRVDLRRELTITGIATQGYGDASVQEWVTSYRLMYAKKQDFAYFTDINGDVLVRMVYNYVYLKTVLVSLRRDRPYHGFCYTVRN